MTSFIQSVDEQTRLAGANRLEVLLFSLGTNHATGRDEVFGINVFKVREVMRVPEITHAPDMPAGVEGFVSLRGTMIPVINLPEFCRVQAAEKPRILMITEYNKQVQGFLVHTVDTIERLGWDEVKAPPVMLSDRLGGMVTAVAELQDKRLVMIIDVEKVLAETAGFYDDDDLYEGLGVSEFAGRYQVLYADDSGVARDQISKTLERMGMRHIGASNGAEAWTKLDEIAHSAEAAGHRAADELQFILTDVEMPEMDGYVLTRRVKEDPRFNGIPVIMHSSLSTEANQDMGKGVGADAYVPKFEPRELAQTLQQMIGDLSPNNTRTG